MKLYETIASELEAQIRSGVYRFGDRMLSVRQASQQRQISVTTVIRAYLLLESRGLIASRPQSGYFVTLRQDEQQSIDPSKREPIAISEEVDVSHLVLSTLRSISTLDAVPLGSPYPDPCAFPFE